MQYTQIALDSLLVRGRKALNSPSDLPIAVALIDDGSVKCWGNNRRRLGQMGSSNAIHQ